MISEIPKTLLEASRYFSDLEICNDYMRSLKWPDGVITCPKCGTEKCSKIAGRPGIHTCNMRGCRKQFSVKVGTIFEDSPLGLDKWFVAIWSIANCKNGISSHELGRAIGITQKSAWFLLHRVRKAMETESFSKLSGDVESDETFIGGAAKNMHAKRRDRVITGRGPTDKTPVQAIVERGGMIRTFVPHDTTAESLGANVLRNVVKGSAIYTDSATACARLLVSYLHEAVNHSVGEWKRGRAHTNTAENFWSLLNRALNGTYICVAAFHLHRYATEQGFRYNHRDLNDAGRFLAVLRGVLGKRLTYRRLAAIGDSGFMGLK